MKMKKYNKINVPKWNIKPMRTTFDSDRDGVPDWKDCQPFNPHKQDASKSKLIAKAIPKIKKELMEQVEDYKKDGMYDNKAEYEKEVRMVKNIKTIEDAFRSMKKMAWDVEAAVDFVAPLLGIKYYYTSDGITELLARGFVKNPGVFQGFDT